ncbi:RHS repeat-associated core domain-containing protein [Streptomyces sp. DSM 41534]
MPFGDVRGTQPTDWPGTRGLVGGTDDTKTTGFTHLGAREYDPTTGRFLSVDPVMEPGDTQQMQGYAYANSNPLTFSDPTGLCEDPGNGHCMPTNGGNAGHGAPPENHYPSGGSSGSSSAGVAARADYRCGYNCQAHHWIRLTCRLPGSGPHNEAGESARPLVAQGSKNQLQGTQPARCHRNVLRHVGPGTLHPGCRRHDWLQQGQTHRSWSQKSGGRRS